MTTTNNNTAKTRRAIKTYTRAKCMQAYAYSCDGEGPSTIGWYLGLTTGQANAAINAGRELSAQAEADNQTHCDDEPHGCRMPFGGSK
jgi:hypothetical protein